MRRPILIGLAAVVVLALVGVGGVFLGRAITKPPSAPAPPGQPTPQTPAGECPPAAENATDGTLDAAPETEWIQATDRVWVPKTKGGPLKDSNGFGQCFTPDAEGAATAAYYYWAMTDTTFSEEVRRTAFEAYIPDEDPNKEQTIANLLADPDRKPIIEGFRVASPVSGNTADIEIHIGGGPPGETIPVELNLAWVHGTWQVGKFRSTGSQASPSDPGPVTQWKRI